MNIRRVTPKWFWDEYGLSSSGFIVSMLTGFVVTMVMLVVVATGFSANACHRYATQTSHVTKFDVWSGCYIETQDGWVPLDNWRNFSGGR